MDNMKEHILSRMKSRLTNPASMLEGSFSADILQSVADEIARLYSTEYERLINRAHLDTAADEDLDRVGINDHGVYRKQATFEEVNVVITGTPGSEITKDVGVKSDNIIFMVSGDYVIPASGNITVTARCTEPGSGNTVQAHTVNHFIRNYDGLTSVTNPFPSSGGYDRESDKKYRRRIKENEKEVKGYGNISWYRNAAKNIQGVEKAKVFDCARGPGTVDVVIVAEGNKVASELIVKKVREYIDSNRSAGADVLVEAASKQDLKITSNIYCAENHSIEKIIDEFHRIISNYLIGMEFKDKVIKISYAKMLNLLLGCTGVTDVESLTINGKQGSFDLPERSFAVAETRPALNKVG